MRRLLAFCAVAVMIFAAFAAVGLNRVATVSAAGGSGNLVRGGGPIAPGCPIGPNVTFCDQAPGTAQLEGTFGVENPVAVTGVLVTQVAAPGMAANFPASCSTGGACDFTIIGNTCTGNLAANQGCAIGLDFTPTALGPRAAALTVTDSAGDTLSIVVEGVGKNLALGPPVPPSCGQQPPIDNAFPFCSEAVGAAGAVSTFTLTAGAPESGIVVSFQAIPGLSSEFAAGDFTVENMTCTGALATLASCNIGVSFTPTAAGLRSAALTATDSNGDTTTIYVSGNTTSGVQVGTPVI
ncbi:MAG: choice-of-anchor D domain-containing protein, partial [Candidatus Acidiferrales bacterium]